nr:PREDICTED: perilipin-3 [Anolis carolinensis]|eukprot:XP_008120430.1 PREDICTED: perilipin-3 [Anolis carolinensis]
MAAQPEGESQEAPKTESVVTRITSLPLVSSTYDACSAVYNYAKETFPYINTACNVAEMVAAVALGSAVGGAQPILNHLEPQISVANQYACKGLDKLEETIPCLNQPAHQVIEEGVVLAKTVVGSTVATAKDAANGARDLVVHRVTAAVDLTKDILQDGVGLTKSVVEATVQTALNAADDAKALVSHRAADVLQLGRDTAKESADLAKAVVSSTVNTALQAAIGTKDLVVSGQVAQAGAVQEGLEMTHFLQQMVATGVDAALGKTEEMVDFYLPFTEAELANLATEVQGFGPAEGQQGYFVRLGSLSSKVRRRAYLHSLTKLRHMKERTQDRLSQLQQVISLVEQLKKGVGQRVQDAQQKLNQLVAEWTQTQPGGVAEGDLPSEVEPRALALLRFVTQDLGPVSLRLVGVLKGLPRSLRERVNQALHNALQLHASFSTVSSIHDLSDGTLTQAHKTATQARECLDTLVKHIAQAAPLNWVVGPFRPSYPLDNNKTETSHPNDQEMEEIPDADVGEEIPAADVGEPPKEMEKASGGLGSVDESGAQENAEVLTKVWSDMPRKARKQEERAVPEKACKSDLNQVSEH